MTQPAVPESMAARVALAQLVPSALNPRRTFTPAADAELLESVQAHGILTPLLVRPIKPAAGQPNGFEIVAGHRRYAAALALGLEDAPVTIRELTDDQAREASIIENLQREDLAPLDEATAYDQLLSRPGETPTTVAAAVGKSPAYIGRRLKLLGLIADAQAALREGRMDVARAELLVKLDEDAQAEALQEAVWLSLFEGYDVEDGRPRTAPAAADSLSSLSELRAWVDRRTRLSLADLADDPETRALFPEASEAVLDAQDARTPTPLLEIALDRFSQSPAKADIPAGVLRLNTDYREVVGKRCATSERAVVVFGQRKGDVVFVCRDKKGCPTHWPPKAKPGHAEKSGPRPSWEQQEAERKRLGAVWERVRPDVEKVVIAASAKVKTTPKLLQDVLGDAARDEVAAVIKAIGGKLTLDNFGRAWVLSAALSDLWDVSGAERALKSVNGFFDVKKAMKAAEAAMAAEATPGKAAVKKVIAETAAAPKKVAGKPAKKGRAA